MSIIKDFSQRKSHPGEDGNPFDTALHWIEKIDKIPDPIYIAVFFLIALIPNYGNQLHTFILFTIFLIDWLLLIFLFRKGKSYGPSKPPALILAVLRMLVAFFPYGISYTLQFIGIGFVIFGFWYEPHKIEISFQKLHSSKLRNSKPLRILHLADLHLERITEREKLLNKLIGELKPDLILFSGDFLNLSYNADPVAIAGARDIIQHWEAPLGTFLVSGSPAVDFPETVYKITDGLPVQFLDTESIMISFGESKLDLIGIGCTHRPSVDKQKLDQFCNNDDRFKILLYHSPDLAPIAVEYGFDLQLSGHTHGGQVRLPAYGALFTGSLYGKRFEAGRYEIGEMTLYVSRGIGMEGAGAPRVRFLCPPEIILWEISSE
ncbi:MAG: metallophosphoesterase [Anaerolineaceae bacterium]|nr:metallophosphoesterase [Anaerolineaceae bacterium]